jgi:sialate O-acetylesterase
MKPVLFFISLLITELSIAQLQLPSFFADNMVMQQQKTNRIWGWAKPGELVSVEFNKNTYKSFANENGQWQIFTEPANAGSVGSLTVKSGKEQVQFNNLLLGEVWVCSGQSNMEWKMNMLGNTYTDEIKSAENDQIRFIVFNKSFSNTLQNNVTLEKNWSTINPSNTGDCSAVAYWYAKKLYQELKVPIGLVITAWGGTPAEAWTSFEGLSAFSNYTNTFVEKIKPLKLNEINRQTQLLVEKYQQSILEKASLMKELIKPEFDDSKWPEMYLPKQWELQGFPNMDGIVAYRVHFQLTDAQIKDEAVLNLPAIDDKDSTFINGILVGTNGQWDALRKYKVPVGVLKSGDNVLVIKVQDDGGGGGIDALDDRFNLVVNQQTILLKGNAKYTIIAAKEAVVGSVGNIQNQPAALFNGMIAPILPLSFRGAIWYQGESNADNKDRSIEYNTLFPAMIKDWRNQFTQGNFPFLFVQLSSFGPLKNEPAESNWALLREAQTNTLQLSNTGMAVTIDVGNPQNIHPVLKKEVGDRLAAIALKSTYHTNSMIASGPQFKSAVFNKNQVIISFTNADNGLLLKGKMLKHFAIAGSDNKFIWGDASIQGNKIIVTHKTIAQPKAIRYAWADSPINANLFNKEGYPAVPFRTDNW